MISGCTQSGTVACSIDSRLVEAVQSYLPLRVLVKTGAIDRDCLVAFHDHFEVIHAVGSPLRYSQAESYQFPEFSNIHLHEAGSPSVLNQLSQKLRAKGVLYFLGAHRLVEVNVAGRTSQCPILKELEAIGSLNEETIVLIDDARILLSPPPEIYETAQWPNFHQIVDKLYTIGPAHEIMVVNDAIAFFPSCARSAMESYSKAFGVDWLLAATFSKPNNIFMRQLRQKEQTVHEQSRALLQKEHTILAKDKVISKLSHTLQIYHVVFSAPLIGPLLRLVVRTLAVLRPRLGNLNQYPAKHNVFLNRKSAKSRELYLTPTICIVTPSYQQGIFIAGAIQSVVDQGYPKLQYFVKDGGSNDSTVSVLGQFEGKLSGWISEEDSGQSQAINIGFDHTDGEIMAWLNSDDLLMPGALHTVASYFNCHPEVDVVYGNRLLIDENDMEIGQWILPGHDSEVLLWADYIPQETLFWRRRIWDKVGGKIDESFHFAMDWDLILRFRAVGAKFGHIPAFLGAFRVHDGQKTSTAMNEAGRKEMDRIRQRYLGSIPNTREIRKAVIPYLVKHMAVDMSYRIKNRLGIRA